MSPRLWWHGLDTMHTLRRTSSRRYGWRSGGVGGAFPARNAGIQRRARRGSRDPIAAPSAPTWRHRRGRHRHVSCRGCAAAFAATWHPMTARVQRAPWRDTILGSCSRCLAQPLGRRAASWCSICCASSRSHCSTQQARQTLGQRAAHSAAPRARVAPPPPARPPHVPLSPAVGPGCRCPWPGGVGVREWVQW